MNPTNEPSLQTFPSITFRNKSYPIRLKVSALLRLKEQGLNLLEQAPSDPFAFPHHEAKIALMEALANGTVEPIADPEAWKELTPEQKKELSPLHAKVDELHGKMSEERRNYVGPLDKTDPLEIAEIALKIVAESIRPHHPNITYMDLADEIDIREAMDLCEKAFSVAKNLFAVPDGPTTAANQTVKPQQ